MTLTYTVDATYDGNSVRDQFIQALSNMAGATMQNSTVPYSNNQATCGTSGGCRLPGGGEQSTSEMAQFKMARTYQLSRFIEGTGGEAGKFRVTINPNDDNDACNICSRNLEPSLAHCRPLPFRRSLGPWVRSLVIKGHRPPR